MRLHKIRLFGHVPTVLWVCVLAAIGCGRLGPGGFDAAVRSQWTLVSTQRLAADELWKQHNGGDQIYIGFGCVSETMKDYRHRSQPWRIQSSIFDQATAGGARSLYEYYLEGVEEALPGVEQIGDATYLWKPSGMRCWTLGFCKGRHFVETSLSDDGRPETPLTDGSRDALLEFARALCGSL